MWLQDSYFDTEAKIIFENISGQEKIFEHSETLHSINDWRIEFDCGDEDRQWVKLIYERIVRIYESQDSFKLTIGTTIYPEECQWGGKDNTRMFERLNVTIANEQSQYYNPDNYWGQLGVITIITNQLESNTVNGWCGDYYTFYSNINLANTDYFDVYGQDSTRILETDIFYSESQGLIGFINKDFVEWKIKI